MFWVISASSEPRRSSSARATWPAFGCAVHAGWSHPLLPRLDADLRIAHVVLDVHELHRLGVRGPHAVRPAEVGDARLGADAGAGEDRDPLGCADEAGNSSIERSGSSLTQRSLGRFTRQAVGRLPLDITFLLSSNDESGDDPPGGSATSGAHPARARAQGGCAPAGGLPDRAQPRLPAARDARRPAPRMWPRPRPGRATRPRRGPDVDPGAAASLADRTRAADRPGMEPDARPSSSG